MTSDNYTNEVLSAYTALRDTPDRPSRYDRALTRNLQRSNVPLSVVQQAMLLATVRRHYRDPALPPLDRIRSLNYFLPIIRQILAEPLDWVYVDYLERKLAAIPHPPTEGQPDENAQPE